MARFDVGTIVGDQAITLSAQDFLWRMQDDFDFLDFVSTQFGNAASAATARANLSEIDNLVNELPKHTAVVDEMFFCRVVDSFLIYVSDLLREILRAKPDILASSEKIRTDRLLKAASIQELIDELIEEQVTTLSYAGFRELREWFSKRGVDLCMEKDDDGILIEAIAVRNLVVHSRGRVDARFKKVVPARPEKVGTFLKLELDETVPAMRTIAKTVSYSDKSAAKKFKLTVERYKAG